MNDDATTLTVSEFAARVGIHRRTALTWLRAGRVKAHRTPGGHWRIRVADADAMPLSTAQFARAVGICQRTAVRWAESGKIAAKRKRKLGDWLIDASEVERIGARRRVVRARKEVADEVAAARQGASRRHRR
jgi:excisionase family DNA binding protein